MTAPAAFELPAAELEELEGAVNRALGTGDSSGLDILGYGEISCVVGLVSGERRLACKRLPLFHAQTDWEAYRQCFDEYLETLTRSGIRPLPSVLQTVSGSGGPIAAWCVQPRLPSAGLLSKHFHHCSEQEATRLFERVLARITSCVSPTVGLDGQLSNWILDGDELYYLDVTTPMLRTADGVERMPISVFMASLPWALRAPVRRFLLRDILDKYYDPRGVVLDLLGNLVKDRLVHLMPVFLERANAKLTPGIGADEPHRYYADDARSWALLQRLRRADRWWQQRIRRRVYPFLLPGSIER